MRHLFRGLAAALAVLCVLAGQSWAASQKFIIAPSDGWQKIASSGANVDVQVTNGVVFITTSSGAPTSPYPGHRLDAGEHRPYTLSADLYALAASNATITVLDNVSSGGGGGGGGGAITSPLGPSTAAAAAVAFTFGSGSTLPAFAATPTFNLGTLNGAATAVNQATEITNLGSILSQLQSGTTPVSLAALPSLAAGANTIGAVTQGAGVTTLPWYIVIEPSVTSSAGIAPVTSNGNSSLVLKASAGALYSAYAVNYSTTAGFLILYNAATAPAAGALTPSLVLDCARLPASGQASISYGIGPPKTFNAGISELVSSGPDCVTYTSGTITAYLNGSVK